MCRSPNECRGGRRRNHDSYLGGFVSRCKIVYLTCGPVLEPGISQVRKNKRVAMFRHFLVKALTAKHLLSPLNEVHTENVRWGGQAYPIDFEFTRLKIFVKSQCLLDRASL